MSDIKIDPITDLIKNWYFYFSFVRFNAVEIKYELKRTKFFHFQSYISRKKFQRYQKYLSIGKT